MSGSLSDSLSSSQTLDTAAPQPSQSHSPGSDSTSKPINYPVTAKASDWAPQGEQNVQLLLDQPRIQECALANQFPLDSQYPATWYTMRLEEPYTMMLPTPQYSKLAGLQLDGIWYRLDGVPLDTNIKQPVATFNGNNMTVTTWTVGHTGYCANFTLVLPPNSNLLGGESRQNLEVRNQQIVPAPGTTFLVTNATFIFSQSSPDLPTSSSGSASDADAVPAESDAPLASSASPNSGSSASGTSNKANVIVPAVVVPLVVILIAGAAFVFLWRRRRRSRMAPSAAFRADHPEAIAAVERSGGATSHLSGTGTSFSSTPTPYFPIDEKRSFAP